jgi:NitT/TauT family transport system substrate-binding protein
MLKRFVVLGLLSLLLGVSFASAQELQEERFLHTFIPNIQFAPTYVTIEQGYFVNAGINVTVEYLNEPDVVDLVATGQSNFGIVSGEQVILAGSQGRPITYVYNWFQKYPIAIVTSDAYDIESPADLVGQTVGVPGRFGATYSGLLAFLAANGLSEADIQVQEIGFNAPEVFCLGQVQASTIYVNNEPLQIQNLADADECGDTTQVRVFPVADSVNLVSNGIITNNALIADNSETVSTFISAFHQGLVDTINNPARAYLLSLAHVENLPITDELQADLEELAIAQDELLALNPTREQVAEARLAMQAVLHEKYDAQTLLQFDVLIATIELWDAEEIGMNQPEAWDNMLATLISMNLPVDEVDVTTLYTNDFVPAVE